MNDGILGKITGDYEKDSKTYGRGERVTQEELREVKDSLGIKEPSVETKRIKQATMEHSNESGNENF